MKILVTGGTGFIGSVISKLLADEGHEVYATGNHPKNRHPKIKYLGLHLDGIDLRYIGGLDAICHQAANNDTIDNDLEQMWKANVFGPIGLFHRAMKGGCKTFVYASSTAVYGASEAPYIESVTKIEPLNVYGESKAAFDKFAIAFAEDHDLNMVGLRYCNVYGPGELAKGKRASMIGQLAHKMQHNKRPQLFKYGEQKRDYIHVDDIAKANIMALDYKGSAIFNCGGGEAWTFNKIVDMLNTELGTDFQPEYIDNPYKDQYQNYTECDISKLKLALPTWSPRSLPQGIHDYIQNWTAA